MTTRHCAAAQCHMLQSRLTSHNTVYYCYIGCGAVIETVFEMFYPLAFDTVAITKTFLRVI